MKNSGMDVENVGIMQGMSEGMDELIEKLISGEEGLDDMDEDDEYETGKMMDRTPDSPEILMNNLRGDMRSIDARKEELADLVGYNAAMETPMEVLALLQPVLAGQGGMPQGVESLMPAAMPGMGAGAPPAQPDMAALMGGQMPAAMPGAAPMPAPEAAPMGQAPLTMANGGYVQNFFDGSDEDGVTPYGSESSYMNVDPSTREMAQAYLISDFMRGTSPVPSRQAAMEEILPVYQDILGTGDKDLTQAQMLAALSQAAFNYAGNVDAQGRPLRGSQAARLAGALAPLPGQMAKLASEQTKEDRAVKLAALQAGEKERESIISANQKVRENQRKAAEALLKDNGKLGANWASAVLQDTALTTAYADGTADLDTVARVEGALSQLLKPTTKYVTNEIGQPVPVTSPATLSPYMIDLVKRRQANVGDAATFINQIGLDKLENEIKTPLSQWEQMGTVRQAFGIDDAPSPVMEGTPDYSGVNRIGSTRDYYDPNSYSMFNLAEEGTGVINLSQAFVGSLPVTGDIFQQNVGKEITNKQFLSGAVESINKALTNTDKFGAQQNQQIKDALKLEPKLLDNSNAYRARIQGLDNLLVARIRNFYKDLERRWPALTSTARQEYVSAVGDLNTTRMLLGGAPTVIPGTGDIYKLRRGQWYVQGFNGPLIQVPMDVPTPLEMLQQRQQAGQ